MRLLRMNPEPVLLPYEIIIMIIAMRPVKSIILLRTLSKEIQSEIDKLLLKFVEESFGLVPDELMPCMQRLKQNASHDAIEACLRCGRMEAAEFIESSLGKYYCDEPINAMHIVISGDNAEMIEYMSRKVPLVGVEIYFVIVLCTVENAVRSLRVILDRYGREAVDDDLIQRAIRAGHTEIVSLLRAK